MRKQDSFNEMYNIYFYRRHKNSLSMLLFLAHHILFILLLFNGLSCIFSKQKFVIVLSELHPIENAIKNS